MRLLRDQTARDRLLSLHYTDGAMRDVPGEHWAILEAALARDANKACVLAHEALKR
ncbi:hypothetical protein NJF44_16395 [Pseudomonas guariconensis]|uniref:hypothetical protein n=1 Tax=Pseudomonas TaxID=286 RepID=UPI001CE4A0BE|nr:MULTISPECIES: hypothetical protein [Pseudomonas]MCO7641635.1 hypothetical protein [Pseudomonas sp. S 311-6]MCO7516501.1 hypothetical protein [Pseudomonas putida]MCO7566771.1 hypothetical protein [Pseudomonas mosselii]MCO7596785.1 hypothetical protein [Pseudomonas guariconensis]MCO7606815.1 hypothetical protein [Pseudomonas guariconensis]